MFGRDAGMAEAWLCSQEPLVRSAELGCTVDEVETLIKRHEAFQKSAAAWEERFSALEKLTAVRVVTLGACPKPLLSLPREDISLLPSTLAKSTHVPHFPIASCPYLLFRFSFLYFLSHQNRAETFQFQLSSSPAPLTRGLLYLTLAFLDSWRSGRRSRGERGKRKNGGNSPLLQSPQLVGPEGTW